MFTVDEQTIFLGLTGSHAYGMAREGSDVDIRGACLVPRFVRDSPFKSFEQFKPEHQKGPWGGEGMPSFQAIERLKGHVTAGRSYTQQDEKLDLVIFSLHKMVGLAAKNNPNILELLFLDDRDVLFADKRWQRLIESRDIFLSRRCKHTYLGYAYKQLSRIQGHREWLLNPPKNPPTRAEFGLPEETVLPADVRNQIDEAITKIVRDWSVADGFEDILKGAFLDALMERMREFQCTVLACTDPELDEKSYLLAAQSAGVGKDVLYMLRQERRYRASRKNWQAFQKWQRERNVARAALEADYGYDTKHGTHLIRLMRTGLEILRDGKLNVRRSDAEELLFIRDGGLSYDDLMAQATTLRAQVEAANLASELPEEPNQGKIEELLLSLLE